MLTRRTSLVARIAWHIPLHLVSIEHARVGNDYQGWVHIRPTRAADVLLGITIGAVIGVVSILADTYQV